ncbi:MAG: hypothetical protein ACHQZR_00015 [Candidatus Limnocylindrales bacterium]
MAGFKSSDAGYGDDEPNDSSEWIQLELTDLKPTDGSPIPFRVLAKRLKSSSPDSERFIHDPLQVLVEEIDEVGDDWHVTTFVVNHHRTLSRIYMYVMVTVAPVEKTVGVTIYKVRPDD